MLSLTPLGKDQGSYYIDLAREDYYLNGGEPPGQWQGAAPLGLTGEVEKTSFSSLLNGHAPDGAPLVQNAGKANHRPGWDLTFSAPKSVSVLWSQVDNKTRRDMQAAHHQAVKTSLQYLENQALTRRGRGGINREPAQLVIATFQHGTSREQDPQLHTHALVMNIGIRQDGGTGALMSQPFYDHKMTAGALYRAELAAQLQRRLGIQVVAKKSWFEVKGIPDPLIKAFSQRRQQIEAVLAQRGQFSATAAAVAALATRQVKGHVAREDLFKAWQARGKAHGFNPAAVLHRHSPPPPVDADRLARTALDGFMAQHSSVTPKDLIRRVAEAAPVHGLDAAAVQRSVQRLLRRPHIVPLGEHQGHPHYTTKELLQLEKRLLHQAATSKQHNPCPVTKRTLTAIHRRYPTLTREQRKALTHITTHGGGIRVISGMAGTGKTFMLNAAREAWQRSGYKVIGAALAGKAAKGLQDGAAINSATLHRTLGQIQRGQLKLTPKTVVVVDEAGMVGTRQLATLMDATTKAGSKLVLVGDAKQLQPIQTGGAFPKLGKELGQVHLTTITRQKQAWARRAVHAMAKGKSRQALNAYAKRGRLTVADTRHQARAQLLTDWQRQGRPLYSNGPVLVAKAESQVY